MLKIGITVMLLMLLMFLVSIMYSWKEGDNEDYSQLSLSPAMYCVYF